MRTLGGYFSLKPESLLTSSRGQACNAGITRVLCISIPTPTHTPGSCRGGVYFNTQNIDGIGALILGNRGNGPVGM